MTDQPPGPAPDDCWMAEAIRLGEMVRGTTSPNPPVGCVVLGTERVSRGATEPPGSRHAEIVALDQAGPDARGATVYVTLEPCAHHGRTPPCTDALIAAGVGRVVVAVRDPDPAVDGRGLQHLCDAGIAVEVGVAAEAAAESLAPYLKHRRTGRPWVVLKLACTLDGRIAAPNGSSRWITGPEARIDAHRLRAASDAILVGAGTIRTDDPELNVRDVTGRDPVRVVLGRVPPGARVRPARERRGELGPLLDELGGRGMLQLLVEGGAQVAGAFHRAGLVDRYVFYVAPKLLGGDDGIPPFWGPGAPSIGDAWRGKVMDVTRLGDDLRIDVAPA